MALAGRLDLVIEQGVTYARTFAYLQNGVPVDLTGMTVKMQAREYMSQVTPVVDLSTAGSGITLSDATSGEYKVALTAAETAAFEFDEAFYDIALVDSGGDVTRLAQGILTISKGVTA